MTPSVSERAMKVRSWLPLSVASIALLVPAFAFPLIRLGDALSAVAFAVAVLGVNLIVGHAGQVALGQAAFVGVGAYTTVVLSADHGWPLLATIPVGAALAFVLGVVLGVPALRINGLYLALITLAFGAAFGPIVKRMSTVTGGTSGKGTPSDMVAPTWFGATRLADARWRYLVVAAIAWTTFLIAGNVVRGRVGRSLVAMRDAEVAATCFGVDVRRTKLVMFGLSAAVAAVAGSLFMVQSAFAIDTTYSPSLSIKLYTAGFIGGITSVYGALVGGFVIVAVPYASARSGFSLEPDLVFGVALVALTLLAPDGMAGALRGRSHR